MVKGFSSLSSAAFAAFFFAINLPRVLNHSVWRDEAQAWLIVRDSGSIFQLFHNLHYEGHPALWYLCLWILQKFTTDVVAMGVLHAFIASACVYVIFRYSPFGRFQKFLIAFGYYFLFEYLLVSRAYGLGALLALTFCVLQDISVVGSCVVLGLLANTSMIGAIISIPLLITVPRTRSWISGALVYMVMFAFAAWVMHPPPDVYFDWAQWHSPFERNRLQGALLVFSSAMFPVPSSSSSFWGTSLIDSGTNLERVLWLIPILAAMSLVIWKSKRELIALGLGFVGILEFAAMRYIGYIRHYGEFWVLFLCLAWIASRRKEFSQSSKFAFTALLVIHAIAGVEASVRAYRVPFSHSRAVADWLKTNYPDKLDSVFADVGALNTSVVAYLDRPIRNVEPGQTQRYWIYKNMSETFSPDRISEEIRLTAAKSGSALMLLPNGPFTGV